LTIFYALLKVAFDRSMFKSVVKVIEDKCRIEIYKAIKAVNRDCCNVYCRYPDYSGLDCNYWTFPNIKGVLKSDFYFSQKAV
jgi:hypothetical protein